MAQDLGNPYALSPDNAYGNKFEYEIKEYLRVNLPKSYSFIHSVVLSISQSRQERHPHEIDFVLAGPNGLFLIEAKWRERVRGQIFGRWIYERFQGQHSASQSKEYDEPGKTMRRRVSQAETRVGEEGGRKFLDYRIPRAIFVFPDTADLQITDDRGRSAHSQGQFWWLHLSELAELIKSLPPPETHGPQQRVGRAKPLTTAEAKELVELFDRGTQPNPQLAGNYEITSRGEPETAPNGLPFIIHKLVHTRLGYTRRGKWYDMSALEEKDKKLFEAQVQRHAKVQSSIPDHPNIHKFYDFSDDHSSKGAWVIEEWIDGDPLDDLLSAPEPLSIDIRNFMEQVAQSLQVLHKNGFVVRDLSPSSIIVEHDTSRAILTNFELAKALDGSPTVVDPTSVNDSPYIAPEVLDDATNLDVRADVYSWGAILFDLATGQRFAGQESINRLDASSLPKPALELARACLSPFYSRRPKNMIEVIKLMNTWPKK